MGPATQDILIGWASRDVSPSGNVSLWGMHYVRLTEEVHDPLTATALALSSPDGSEQAILVSLDAVAVTDYVTAGCRDRLSRELPDFRPDMLLISGTHTHTAPDQPEGVWSLRPELGEDVVTEQAYGDLLIERITEAAVEAWTRRAPGALSWGRSHAVVGFNRRTSYFDGSTRMYGATDTPEFSHIEGHEDHAVELLFTYDAQHTLTGMVVNVPCPAQCTGGACFVSADYWHEAREAIRRGHGRRLHILAQCSAAGDLSPHTLLARKADARMLRLKGYGDDYNLARRFEIAERLAAAVAEVLPAASQEIHGQVAFHHRRLTLDLPRRRPTPADLAEAAQNVAHQDDQLAALGTCDPTAVDCSKALMLRALNQHVIDIHHAQERGERLVLPVELHVLRVGDIALCTNRFELGLDFGDRIKGRSKALQTFVVQLTGQARYLLSERSARGGSYGVSVESSPVGPDGGQQVVEATVAAIEELFPGADG